MVKCIGKVELTKHGIQNVANRKDTQDSYGKRVQAKNELLQKWDDIKAELIEKGVPEDKMPKFKSGAL